MNKIFSLLISTRLTAVLMVVFASVMGIATFIENTYGTITAQAYIYKSKWFEFIMLLMLLNFVGNIKRYHLLDRKKWATFLIHLAFIVILIGAFVSRIFGYEGQIQIAEGESANIIQSRDTYFKYELLPLQKTGVSIFKEDPYLLSPYHKNYNYQLEVEGLKTPINFKLKDYIQAPYNNTTNLQAVQIVTRDSMQGAAKNQYLVRGASIMVKGEVIGFETTNAKIINIIEKGGKLYLKAPFDFISQNMMKNNEEVHYTAGQEVPISTVLYSTAKTKFMVMQNTIDHLIIGELSCGSERKMVAFSGKEFDMSNWSEAYTIGGARLKISYGSSILDRKYLLPFHIRLNDFQLEKYPGSENPASFASEVSIMDQKQQMSHRIFMNNVLDYKGFRFFQASYNINSNGQEETILSVNADFWGTWITYIGYFLMALGMFLTFFWKGSHFRKLLKKLGQSLPIYTLITLLLSSIVSLSAQEKESSIMHKMMQQSARLDPAHEAKLKRLLVQDQKGRIKPIDTHARELIEYIHGKPHFDSLSATEAFLSLTIFTPKWFDKEFILVGKKGGAELINIAQASLKSGKYYTSPQKLMTPRTGNLTLFDIYETSFNKKDADKTEFDKEVIKLVERVSIIDGMNRGSYFWVVPDLASKNNDWNSWAAHSGDEGKFFPKGRELISAYFNAVLQATATQDWNKANENLENIRQYQQKEDSKLLMSNQQISLELLSNKWNIFTLTQIAYAILGVITLIIAFYALFNTKKWIKTVRYSLLTLVIAVFLFQTFGIGLRWYISDHAPWSNAYEIIIFVSWATILATLTLRANNFFILSGGTLMATLLMLFNFITDSSPAVSTLVPVLKSYWLVIHVVVISSSYGFFALCFILGIYNLILMALRKEQNYTTLTYYIKELTTVSEMLLTIGLYALSIGTFLGGVWANESWGRYWSWDPKETWAFISMFVYALIVHFRLIPGLRGALTYNLATILAFSAILMTFVGVNYFLSGMHSYGKGDPIPILNWAMPLLVIILSLALIAHWKNKKMMALKKNRPLSFY